jgi:hypothetical protein
VGFRRFVVVQGLHGSSLCVPVLTYDRRGCAKKGVDPAYHGIVYNPPNQPALTAEEAEIPVEPGVNPVRVHIDAEGETLALASRINYGKFQTVEHNSRVFFIGYIYPDDLDIVEYATTWSLSQMQRPRQERRRR